MNELWGHVDARTSLAGSNRLEILLFSLSNQEVYGINVFKVREVIEPPAFVGVPGAEPALLGIANVRGATVPIIDLSRAVSLPAPCVTGADGGGIKSCRVILAEFNGSLQGFLVSKVWRIINLPWESVQPPPPGIGASAPLTGIARANLAVDEPESLVQILDVEAVLARFGVGDEGVEEDAIVGLDAVRKGNFSVFVADDSNFVRQKQLEPLLLEIGVHATFFRNGRELLDALSAIAKNGKLAVQDRVHLVISDIEMPVMDGYSLTSAIRQNQATSDLKVILYSSVSGDFNQAMVKKVGANKLVTKTDPTALATAICDLLTESSAT